MNIKTKLIALLLCCLFFSACAAPVVAEKSPDPKVMQEARRRYRDSTLVIKGVCTGTHINSEGLMCYDLEITEIIAGEADKGDRIHSTHPMSEGGEYLLYLSGGEDVLHAEDVTGYTLQDDPLPVTDGMVVWDASSVKLEDLMEDIEQIKKIVAAPANFYFHNELSGLVGAADEILIGRVKELPVLKELPFRTRSEGVSTESNPRASIAVIEAYGSVKGKANYGDTLSLIYCPESVASILDADTLTAFALRYPVPRLREDELYLFFLNYGPDAKQPYMFPVNIYQGFVRLAGDTLYVPNSNAALKDYRSLTPLVKDIKDILNKG
ncbi:MAG: hypothetical protein BWY11_01537 [Firmicutes bacterium ADurb.Bin182]|nr:MAG: hypothetical protein BWY11_01537 [Firmicutes bacterium ADurb.Bin182]